MEGFSSSIRKGLKEYWKRRGYRRLNESGRRRRKTVELGGTTGTRRSWRIKISPKVRILRIPSPKKMVLWLRDAYVRMMMSLANSKVLGMSASATGYGGISMGGGLCRAPPTKEYDDKMLIHMYKSLMMAQGQLVRRDAPQQHPGWPQKSLAHGETRMATMF